MTVAGPSNSLTDVRGLRVGHLTRAGDGWLTGVTVVLAPPGGAVGGVDVRGGGPGTRETDLLDPRNSVERVHAVVLAGGSAYGLAAAHGVLTGLAARGRGLSVGPEPAHVVPIVPAAVLFDLGRGGVFGRYPDERAGAAALDAALAPGGDGPVACGNAGAGTGALAGGLKGGVGSASAVVELPAADPVTVAALAAVNPAGSVTDERSGLLYGAPFGLPGEFDGLRPPSAADLAAAKPAAAGGVLGPRGSGRGPRAAAPPTLNTTLGVIACDASLTKAQCAKLAGVGHDGLARAIRPAHSTFDGDTIFALALGDGPAAPLGDFHLLLTAAADCFTRAVVHAVLAAQTVTTPAGHWPSYLGQFPSARPR